jgi:hypothetical protein
MLPDAPVVFFHIPKTAGTTLITLFQRIFAGRTQYITGRGGSSHIEDCARFLDLPAETGGGFGLVAGHLEMPVIRAIPGKPFVFTFLRKPWERLVSLYCFVKRTPGHHMHQWIVQRDASLEEFVRNCPWDELQNGMTRRLAGVALGRSGDKQLLRMAMDNIQRYFSFVGLQESFDKSLFCLGRQLSIDANALVSTKENVNPDPKAGPDVDAAARERILSYNALDFELYGLCSSKFRAESARLFKGPVLKEFNTFKRTVKAPGARLERASRGLKVQESRLLP